MQLESESLESEIKVSGITLVDYYADWCGPCKMMSPILDMIAKNPEIKVIKVDTEKFTDIARAHSIQSLPTIEIYKDGVLAETKVGAVPKPTLEKLIASL